MTSSPASTKTLPRSGTARSNRRPSTGRGGLLPYVLVAPLVLTVGVLAVYPTGITTVEAFFKVNPLYPREFSGLGNFTEVFSAPNVKITFWNTILYVVIGVVGSVVLGTLIAYTLRRSFRSRGVVLACLVLPWAIPSVVGAVVWNWMLDSNFGVINGALESLGIIHNYHVWLGLERFATIAWIELVQIWQITPLAALVILAAMQNIPSDLYEAAQLDGAGPWTAFRMITLQLIRPAIALSAVQSAVLSLNIFDQVFVMNGNATNANSLMVETYTESFSKLDFGHGYALSLTAMLLTVSITLTLLGVLYRRVTL